MVEAAGVEPSRRDSVNRLMAHDFHALCPYSLSPFTHSESTPVNSYPLLSTPARER
jgi:hypothetical protein